MADSLQKGRPGWLPAALSLVRVPLAAAFPFAVDDPPWALTIVAAAGLSDVLDGWCARRMHRATPAGAILDPVMDKIFVAAVVLTLLFTQRMSFLMALLVGTRDILEVPLAAWSAFEPKLLANRRGEVKANRFGKAATLLQFATITAAIAAAEYVTFLALSCALAGAVAAATYWSRVFTTRRGSRKGFDAPRFGA